jgi:hypothetical protein
MLLINRLLMAKSYLGAKPSNTSKHSKSKNGSFWVDF